MILNNEDCLEIIYNRKKILFVGTIATSSLGVYFLFSGVSKKLITYYDKR